MWLVCWIHSMVVFSNLFSKDQPTLARQLLWRRWVGLHRTRGFIFSYYIICNVDLCFPGAPDGHQLHILHALVWLFFQYGLLLGFCRSLDGCSLFHDCYILLSSLSTSKMLRFIRVPCSVFITPDLNEKWVLLRKMRDFIPLMTAIKSFSSIKKETEASPTYPPIVTGRKYVDHVCKVNFCCVFPTSGQIFILIGQRFCFGWYKLFAAPLTHFWY